MSYKIVVMSCDKNKDLWKPFYHCMEKYWANHPEIIYSTESIKNPYYKTICRNLPIEQWTRRVYETIKDLPCKNILLMVDDLFMRDNVDNDFIWSLQSYLDKPRVAALNFEFQFDKGDVPIDKLVSLRSYNGKFKVSCMCQMWRKSAMLDLFNCDKDPWRFEKDNNAKNYNFLISKNGDFLNWGKPKDRWQWGIVKGKWTQETKDFFDKENIEVDYSQRGFYEEKNT